MVKRNVRPPTKKKPQKADLLVDRKRLERVASNIAVLLGDFLKIVENHASKTLHIRKKILADLKPLLVSLSQEEHEAFGDMLVEILKVKLKKGARPNVALNVGRTNECLGRKGGGVTVISDGAFVNACITVNGSPSGGGVEGGFRY